MVGAGQARATTVVAVAPGPMDVTGYGGYLRQFFTSVRVAATLSNPYRIHNQEWGGHVYVCTGPRHPWARCGPGCGTTTDRRRVWAAAQVPDPDGLGRRSGDEAAPQAYPGGSGDRS